MFTSKQQQIFLLLLKYILIASAQSLIPYHSYSSNSSPANAASPPQPSTSEWIGVTRTANSETTASPTRTTSASGSDGKAEVTNFGPFKTSSNVNTRTENSQNSKDNPEWLMSEVSYGFSDNDYPYMIQRNSKSSNKDYTSPEDDQRSRGNQPTSSESFDSGYNRGGKTVKRKVLKCRTADGIKLTGDDCRKFMEEGNSPSSLNKKRTRANHSSRFDESEAKDSSKRYESTRRKQQNKAYDEDKKRLDKEEDEQWFREIQDWEKKMRPHVQSFGTRRTEDKLESRDADLGIKYLKENDEDDHHGNNKEFDSQGFRIREHDARPGKPSSPPRRHHPSPSRHSEPSHLSGRDSGDYSDRSEGSEDEDHSDKGSSDDLDHHDYRNNRKAGRTYDHRKEDYYFTPKAKNEEGVRYYTPSQGYDDQASRGKEYKSQTSQVAPQSPKEGNSGPKAESDSEGEYERGSNDDFSRSSTSFNNNEDDFDTAFRDSFAEDNNYRGQESRKIGKIADDEKKSANVNSGQNATNRVVIRPNKGQREAILRTSILVD